MYKAANPPFDGPIRVHWDFDNPKSFKVPTINSLTTSEKLNFPFLPNNKIENSQKNHQSSRYYI